MKRMWKKGCRQIAVLLMFACVFSQTMFVYATESSEEHVPESTEEMQTGTEASLPEESETEADAVQKPDMPSESDGMTVEETEQSSETIMEETGAPTETASETISETVSFYGAGENSAPEVMPDVEYQTHVQSYGWSLGPVRNGEMSGTEHKSKRLEGIKISVQNAGVGGDIEYRTHVQSFGWQEYVKNGDFSGTEGKYKRLEGIQIRLTGELAEKYDVYYCVHVQSLGWLNWAKNDEMAGTSGLAKRLEGIRIRLVKKGEAAPAPVGEREITCAMLPGVTYQAHQQTYGTMDWVAEGATCGVPGNNKRMESLAVKLTGETNLTGTVEYRTYVQSYGWRDWTGNGELNGTSGKSKRVEALQIRLTGQLANVSDVYYRVYVQDYGWLGWAKNGETAGTVNLAMRAEAIEIRIGSKSGIKPVPLGQAAYHEFTGPGFYANIYYSAPAVRGGGTGWTTRNGNRYYLVNGAPVTGWRYIGGLKYYFNGDGSLCQNVDGIIGPQSSYQIKVNKQANCVTVYAADGANGYIIPVKAMLCSTGDDTPLGTRPTLAKHRWQTMFNGTQAQFATRLTQSPGVLFHSITYESRNNRTMLTEGYNGLGIIRSAGCIRLLCGEAYWLYQRCAVGTLVTVYNDSNPGPFDRPVLVPIPANQKWDPTDPTL